MNKGKSLKKETHTHVCVHIHCLKLDVEWEPCLGTRQKPSFQNWHKISLSWLDVSCRVGHRFWNFSQHKDFKTKSGIWDRIVTVKK